MGIRYRSGKTEQITLEKPLQSPPRLPHEQKTIDIVRDLASSLTVKEIAARLNEDGLVTPEGNPFTTASIQYIRYKHHIDGLYQVSGNWMSVKEAAAFFGVDKFII